MWITEFYGKKYTDSYKWNCNVNKLVCAYSYVQSYKIYDYVQVKSYSSDYEGFLQMNWMKNNLETTCI